MHKMGAFVTGLFFGALLAAMTIKNARSNLSLVCSGQYLTCRSVQPGEVFNADKLSVKPWEMNQ